MTHIDTLAHIQSRVRNGEEWEWSAPLSKSWNYPEDQSVDNLNRFVKAGDNVRLVPKPELLPCPFCGGRVTLEKFANGAAAYYVVCPEKSICRGSKMLITLKEANLTEAVNVWNRRNPCTCAVEEKR